MGKKSPRTRRPCPARRQARQEEPPRRPWAHCGGLQGHGRAARIHLRAGQDPVPSCHRSHSPTATTSRDGHQERARNGVASLFGAGRQPLTRRRFAAYREKGFALTSAHQGTDRPFTVVVCAVCAADHHLSVIDELRPAIRRCPRAMLVSSACMLGPLTCAARPTGCGVMAVVQPCTNDREACGPPHWIGPITDHGQAAALRDWLQLGRWEDTPLPTQLVRHRVWTANSSRRN